MNQRRSKKNAKKKARNSINDSNASLLNVSVPVLIAEDHEEVNHFFKTIVVPKDLDKLKEKLIEHAAYRKEMILHQFEEYKEIWDFYFVCSHMVIIFIYLIFWFVKIVNVFIRELFLFKLQVLFDFDVMFGSANSNRLIDLWPKIRHLPFRDHGIRIDQKKFPICSANESIYDILTFLKLFATHRVSFDKALTELVTFSEVCFEKYIF